MAPFADTSFLVAAAAPSDDRHAEATELAKRNLPGGAVVTNHVIGETWTVLRRRYGHRVALRFVDGVLGSPRFHLVRASEANERRALDWLRGRDERAYSFVDAVSFEIMRDRGIREALAFDQDFTAAGFVELRI